MAYGTPLLFHPARSCQFSGYNNNNNKNMAQMPPLQQQQQYEAQIANEQAYAAAVQQQQQQQQHQQYAGQPLVPAVGTPEGMVMPTQAYPNQVYAGGQQNYAGMQQYGAPAGVDLSGSMYGPNQGQYGQPQFAGVPQAGMQQQAGMLGGVGGVQPVYQQPPPGYLSRGGFKQFGSFRDSIRGGCCTIS